MLEKLQEAIRLLDVNAMFTKLLLYIPNILAATLIMIIFFGVYLLISFFLKRSFARYQVSASVSDVVVKLIRYGCLGIGLMIASDQIGIRVITLISTLGVAGLAIGLAAQQTLSNMISGLIILIDKPFREGDYVVLYDNYGRVEKICLRSTLLRTPDNMMIDLPNHKIIESKIENHSAYPELRLRVPFGIAYKEYIPEAQRVVLDVVKDEPRILSNPAPRVVVSEIGESSIDMELHVWIDDPAQELDLGYELRQKIKLALDKAGIEIPFPHRQLFLEKINFQGVEKVLGSS